MPRWTRLMPRAARLLLGCAIVVLAQACGGAEETSPRFRFERHYLDLEYGGNGRPGWVRAGDVDGDGDPDVVAGGGEALYVYENAGSARSWVRHGSLDATGRIGANGAVLRDVDSDGDLDVLSAQYRSRLGWWENRGSLSVGSWPFHALADGAGFFAHDVVAADLDGDGREAEILVALYRKPEVRLVWLAPPPTPGEPWARSVVEPGRDEGEIHYAGLDVGDVDRDGDVDIAFSNGWYERLDPAGGRWRWHAVTRIRGISNARLLDLNGDGRLDLVLSAGHHGRGVHWFEAPRDPAGDWTRHDVAPDLLHPECLQAADLDRDGDPDLVTCDLDFERWDREVHRVYVLENLGRGASWRRHRTAPPGFPSHLLQLADVNQDGWLDLLSEATGYSVVTYHERVPPPPTLVPGGQATGD